MRSRVVLRSAIIALLTLLCASASAQQMERPAGKDHTGIFLHAGTGLGFLNATIHANSHKERIYGATALFDMAVGASVIPGLALHGSLFGGLMFAPNVKFDGHKLDTRDDAEFDMVGLGGGATYYTPINLYVSASAGLSLVSAGTPGDHVALKPGIAANARVGYEWWLTRQLGLGVGLLFLFASNEDKDVHKTWNTFGGGPVASFTFN